MPKTKEQIHAAYVRNLNDTKWCLIGFGVDQPEAEMLLEVRLKNLKRGTKTKLRQFKDKSDAPEYY